MITDKFLLAMETALSLIREVKIVPLFEGYPTSGYLFTKLTGHRTKIEMENAQYEIVITFVVTTILKERDVSLQEKERPYLELLNLQEKIQFYLLEHDNPYKVLAHHFPHPVFNFTGRFKAYPMTTEPSTVGPMFFASHDKPTEREQGIYLSQVFEAPVMRVNRACGFGHESWNDLGFVKKFIP